MKKAVSILLIIFSSFVSFSQGLLGGEIGWKCSGNGQYEFYLKVYQACHNDSTYNLELDSIQLLETDGPFGSNILSLESGFPIEHSPICNSDTSLPKSKCNNPDYFSSFNGAHKEYIFSAIISLSGVPPINGWTFWWDGGSRNPSMNLPDSLAQTMRIRSSIYPYNGTDASVCFDNSPIFRESPIVINCNSFPLGYHPFHSDHELDSFAFEWSQPLDTMNNYVSFTSGATYLSPINNVSQNPNFVPIIYDPYEGSLYFTSYDKGGFFATIKNSTFKCGIKVAESHREMYFLLDSCLNPIPPAFYPPFPNYVYTDSIIAGDTLDIDLTFISQQLLPTGINHHIKMNTYSSQYGEYIPANGAIPATFSDTVGCLNPPCAKLTEAPSDSIPVVGNDSLITNFYWETDCGHLATDIGCGVTSNAYQYYFKSWNDNCPFPATTYTSMKVVVLSPNYFNYPLQTQLLDTVLVDSSSGDATIVWNDINDSLNYFSHHIVFTKNYWNQLFTPLDTLYNKFDTTYTHIGADALNTNNYYFIATFVNNGCDPDQSSISNTVSSIAVIPPQYYDIAIHQVVAPLQVNNNYFSIVVKNEGTFPIGNAQFWYYQPDSTKSYTYWNGIIQPGLLEYISITHPFITPSPGSAYNHLCVHAEMSWDLNSNNNTKCYQLDLGMESKESSPYVEIYPNPANQSVKVNLSNQENGEAQINIMDLNGRILISTLLGLHQSKCSINTHSLKNGTYFLSLKTKDQIINKRLVILH